MRYGGTKLTKVQTDTLVIPRGEQDIVITVRSVDDETDFLNLCPMPTPPQRLLPGGVKQVNTESPEYKSAMMKWSSQKMAWLIIKSLSATEELEWDTIVADDPETWLNYEKELQESFSQLEISLIIEKVLTVCGLNSSKIEQATKDFLLTTRQEHVS